MLICLFTEMLVLMEDDRERGETMLAEIKKDTLTVNEVCSVLGISRATLLRRIRDKRIEPLPRRNPALDKEPLFFKKEDVAKLLRTND